MKETHILTDKEHTAQPLEVFSGEKFARVTTLDIAENPIDGFKGFGVAITGASCYNLSIMEEKERTELLRNIYSKSGLGLSVGRLTIGSSDYSAELYSYDDTPFDTELKDFSIERDEKYIIPMIKEILKINPDLFLFASPWSPPGWMKTGGNMCGGYMRREYVECYADYFVKYLKAYAEHGIKISAITPQNEPETQQNGLMAACVWHPEIEAEFIKTLSRKLKENELDVKIWMYDHNFEGVDRVRWTLNNCDNLRESCDAVAFHYYGGHIEETQILKREFPGIELNFTEGGPRLYDNYGTDWCKWGIMIAKTIKCGYSSFTGWNLLLNEMGGPNIGPFSCGGLVTRNSATGELSYSGQYKALSHISKYIDERSKLYPMSLAGECGLDMYGYPRENRALEGFMIDNNDGKNAVVLINPNEGKRHVQFYLNNKWWCAELPSESISTIII